MRAFKDAGIIAAAGVVLIPIGLIGGTTYVVKRHHRDQQDKALIGRHLAESGYAVPVSMPPDSQLRKRAFFPITPSPTQLAVRFSANGSSREVILDLLGLAGLHLKAQRARTASIRPVNGYLSR